MSKHQKSGRFNSNDFIFRPTAMGQAFWALGYQDVPCVREERFSLTATPRNRAGVRQKHAPSIHAHVKSRA